MGCGDWDSGVGVSDMLHAIETHTCDFQESLRVGPDGGVFMISRGLGGGARLVRRTTL
jgi:hypothetical protein